jgi:hypothetical protein
MTNDSKPCEECHGAPEVHGSCQCEFAQKVRKQIELARHIQEFGCTMRCATCPDLDYCDQAVIQ